MSLNITRREMLRLMGLAAAGTAVAACSPTATPAPTAAPTAAPADTGGETEEATTAPEPTAVPEPTSEPEATGFQGEIEFYPQAYLPASVDTNNDPGHVKRYAMDTLAEEWEDLHPGIDLVFIPAPTGEYTDWINTQLIGGTGPDIFWLWLGSLNGWADEGKTVTINDYLELPNKYTSEDTPWKDTFLDPFMAMISAKGLFGGVPLDLVSTGVYTNKDLLTEAGIDFDAAINPDLGSQENWEVLMDWCQTLQEYGKVPFAMSGSAPDWAWRALADQICYGWLDWMDLLNYHDATPMAKQVGFISQEEMQHAWWCMDWNPFADDAVLDMYKIYYRWNTYMQDNWTARDGANAYELFVTGEAAMLWDGSWQLGPLLADDRRGFEMVSFWLPPITAETSSFVQDPPILPIGAGGYGSIAYGLNHMCVQRGNVDECVDWLMYITTPENDEMIVNEVPSFVPAVVGTTALPEIQNLFIGVDRLVEGGHPIRSLEFIFGYAESKYNDRWYREGELFFLDQQSLEDTMANCTDICTESADADLREAAIQYSDDGDWDLTQWTCQPEI